MALAKTLDRPVKDWQDVLILDQDYKQVRSFRMNTEPTNLDFEGGSQKDGLPIGWHGRAGEAYRFLVDTGEARSGRASGRLSYVADPRNHRYGIVAECRVTQCIEPGAFRGKRIAYSGYLKTSDVKGRVGLWMRVDCLGRYTDLDFDNMSDRPIKGSTDWTQYEIVLDVPEEANGICFGFLLVDEGTVWGDDLAIEILGPVGTGPEPTSGNFPTPPPPINLDFEGDVRPNGFPRGWGGGGEGYQLSADGKVAHTGNASGCIRSTARSGPRDFGSLTQCVQPGAFRGERVRYSGYLKTAGVKGWAGLWMRVDGSGRQTSLAFDNMGDRPVVGSTDWTQYEIVLDVPEEATGICFGFLLVDEGTVWGDDFALEILGRRTGGGSLRADIARPLSAFRPLEELNASDRLEAEPFYGRVDEQRQFRDLLMELREAPRKTVATWSPVVVVHGIGGIGKSTLASRFMSIASGELPHTEYKDKFSIVAVDWGRVGELVSVGRNLSFEPVVDLLYQECSQTEEIVRHFDSFRKLRTRRHLVMAKMERLAVDLARQPGFSSGWTDASTKVIGPVLRGGKAAAGVLSPAMGALVQGLPAEAGMQSWLRDRLNPEDVELLNQPHHALASVFAEGLRAAAVQRPLLLFLDTYEAVASAGRWLREIMRHSGPRVAWVVCGRLEGDQPGWPSELGAYRKELPSHGLRLFEPGAFRSETLRAYFAWAAPERPADQTEIAQLHAATGGIPLAVRLAASLWGRGVPMEAITKGIETGEGTPTVVAAMTDRFLVHLRRDESLRPDLERIYGMGLAARPDDPELLAALWGTEHVADGLEALAQRHDFVLAGRFRLHDSVRAFLQRYLLDPIRRYEVREGNRRAVALLEKRLAFRQQQLITLEQRTGSDEWVADLVALVWHRFWLDDQAGWATVLAVFPAAIAYNSELGRALLDVASHFVIAPGQRDKTLLRLLEDTLGPITSRANRIESDALAEFVRPMPRGEVEPDDGCHDERVALIAWLDSERALKHDDLVGAVRHLTFAAGRAPASAVQLCEWVAQTLILLSRESVSLGKLDLDTGLCAADLAVQLQPDSPQAHRMRGLILFEVGRLAESLAAYDRAIDLDPDDPAAVLNRSVILRDQGRLTEALNACNRIIELERASGIIASHRGDILRQIGRLEEALSAYRHAIEVDPNIAVAHLNGGHALSELGRVTEAINAYSRAIDSGHPDHASVAAEALDLLIRGGSC